MQSPNPRPYLSYSPIDFDMSRKNLWLMAATLACSGCASPFLASLPEWDPIPEPDTAQVESILFLVGDAGNVTLEESPLLQKLALDVEAWSGSLRRDATVAVIYLGDNVYPEGVREPHDPYYAQDSARLQAQVDVVAGPLARRYKAAAFFVPGNHDWGNLRGGPGVQRLRNEETFLTRRREEGVSVRLLPPAGRPGPAEVEFGKQLRLLFLDTAWWLFNYTTPQKTSMLAATDQALRRTGNRTVLMFAHHPLRSGGAHGGLIPFWETIGVRYLLARSGTVLQDLNSIPFRRLHDEMKAIFKRTTMPFIWVGGHDHSLQVLRGTALDEVPFVFASGSASKLTDVGDAEGQLFREAAPGFLKLIMKRDATMDLYVSGTGDAFLKCTQQDSLARDRCVKDGVAGFQTIFSMHLRDQRRERR